ncbi:MAG: multicopper oxidase domain-containing protein [Thermomicrobiales bacterium]|nr:multicopper oxidase domain-containing protein [Thermomicrobiales bacterium]
MTGDRPTTVSGALEALDQLTIGRRGFLQKATAAGLMFPAMAVGSTRVAFAQDDEEGDDGYVGSDASTAGSTGDASPIAEGEVAEFQLYDPFLPTVEPGDKDIEIVAIDKNLAVSRKVNYAGWTFDGSIPGRTFRVVEGDTVNFTFSIDPNASTAHSVDFHSAKTPPEVNYRTITPGESFSWSYTATTPGAFMYHCGTPPVLMHIGSGMYGAMIVDPKEGWSPAQELIFVQSEFYLKDSGTGLMVPDYTLMTGHGSPTFVTFNGYANQYVENPISIKVGEPVRIFVVNCGPNIWSSFHVVGAIFDKGYINANPYNELRGLQSITVGPGDGACVEFTVDEPGDYVAVNHAFGHASQGAIAILQAR